jgi:hypothetical protein
MDYRKRRTEHDPILIDGAVVEHVESFKFLGVHINKLSWSKHTKPVVKSAQLEPIPPQETEKIWQSSQSSTAAPSRAWLQHCLVWQLLGLRPQGTTVCTTESSACGPVHHWG